MGCCYEVDGDEGEILGDPPEIGSLGGDCCSPAEVDKVPDSASCDDCSYYWLKGVGVAFSLEEGPPEGSCGCCERLKGNVIAVVAVGTKVDFVDCRGGKRGGGGMFPAVVALVYVGV